MKENQTQFERKGNITQRSYVNRVKGIAMIWNTEKRMKQKGIRPDETITTDEFDRRYN